MWLRAFLVLLLLCQGGEAGNTIDCIENTGGTCVSEDCFAWRGSTRCDVGRCFCTDGSCAGGDGICTSTPYAKVGGNGSEQGVYRLRSARWPDYYMDIDSFGTVDFETGADSDDRKFTLSMPSYAGGEEPLRQPIFIIASVRWPDASLLVTESTDSDGVTSYSAQCLNVDGAVGGLGGDPSVAAVGMILTKAPVSSPEGNYPLMLSSLKYPNRFIYVPQMGLSTEVYKNDPGAGGYWWFEPPLPEDVQAKLLPYSGTRCSFSCGEVASQNESAVDAATLGGVSTRLLVVIALALGSALSPLAS